jgi:hypothetical protein
MSDQAATRKRILQNVERFNAAFRRGAGFKELGPLLHDDVVLTLPGFVARVQGREACLKAYEDTCSQMKIEKLDASDEHVDVYGATAVESAFWGNTAASGGAAFLTAGCEMAQCSLVGNTAAGAGGGLAVSGTGVKVRNTVIAHGSSGVALPGGDGLEGLARGIDAEAEDVQLALGKLR